MFNQKNGWQRVNLGLFTTRAVEAWLAPRRVAKDTNVSYHKPAYKAVDGVAILTKWFCDVIWFKLSPRGKETCAFQISYENKYKS